MTTSAHKVTHDITHSPEYQTPGCLFCANTWQCSRCAHVFEDGSGPPKKCPKLQGL